MQGIKLFKVIGSQRVTLETRAHCDPLGTGIVHPAEPWSLQDETRCVLDKQHKVKRVGSKLKL